jgi:hypothetical protein
MNRNHLIMAALGSVLVATMLFPAVANAVPVFLPLSSINPGTEHVTLLPNGDFESPAGGSAFATDWTRSNDMVTSTPVNGVASDGAEVAAAHGDGGHDVNTYQQTISVNPNTDYVLSGYIWDFGSGGSGANASIDLNDNAATIPADNAGVQIEVILGTASSSNGFFAYSPFNSGPNTSLTVRVFTDGGVGTLPALLAQWDNVAITPASTFVAPTAVPEPTSLALIGIGAMSLLGRHRRA